MIPRFHVLLPQPSRSSYFVCVAPLSVAETVQMYVALIVTPAVDHAIQRTCCHACESTTGTDLSNTTAPSFDDYNRLLVLYITLGINIPLHIAAPTKLNHHYTA